MTEQINKALYGNKNPSVPQAHENTMGPGPEIPEEELDMEEYEDCEGEESLTVGPEDFETEEEYREFLKARYEVLAVDPASVTFLSCPVNQGMQCSACMNFAEDTHTIVRGFLEQAIPFVANVLYGECHAAPVMDPENPAGCATFPIVPGYQWCGQWKLGPSRRYSAEEEESEYLEEAQADIEAMEAEGPEAANN